jgi:hypothetical protein
MPAPRLIPSADEAEPPATGQLGRGGGDARPPHLRPVTLTGKNAQLCTMIQLP